MAARVCRAPYTDGRGQWALGQPGRWWETWQPRRGWPDTVPRVGMQQDPGAQSVSLAEPTGQKVPAAHVRQSLSAVIVIDEFMRLPPGQGAFASPPACRGARRRATEPATSRASTKTMLFH